MRVSNVSFKSLMKTGVQVTSYKSQVAGFFSRFQDATENLHKFGCFGQNVQEVFWDFSVYMFMSELHCVFGIRKTRSSRKQLVHIY